jgi:prepilin-type N-terminal cleavage/methylation domain-containing protein
MSSTRLRRSRAGFTLVEVALAVAVGLIIIGGAVLGYNAVKDSAGNSNARDRLMTATAMVEEYAAANNGKYPTAGTNTFTTMWKSKRPDDYTSSPWGGQSGGPTGVDEATAAFAGASVSPTVASVTGAVTGIGTIGTADPTKSADMIYMQISPTSPWAGLKEFSTASLVAVKNYSTGIFDKNGQPWWFALGGK